MGVSKKLPVLWGDVVVGWIADARGDTFDLYGEWHPVDGDVTRRFVEAIRAEEEVWVKVGTKEPRISGVVEREPEGKMEIKCYPEKEP